MGIHGLWRRRLGVFGGNALRIVWLMRRIDIWVVGWLARLLLAVWLCCTIVTRVLAWMVLAVVGHSGWSILPLVILAVIWGVVIVLAWVILPVVVAVSRFALIPRLLLALTISSSVGAVTRAVSSCPIRSRSPIVLPRTRAMSASRSRPITRVLAVAIRRRVG